MKKSVNEIIARVVGAATKVAAHGDPLLKACCPACNKPALVAIPILVALGIAKTDIARGLKTTPRAVARELRHIAAMDDEQRAHLHRKITLARNALREEGIVVPKFIKL